MVRLVFLTSAFEPVRHGRPGACRRLRRLAVMLPRPDSWGRLSGVYSATAGEGVSRLQDTVRLLEERQFVG